MKWFKLKLWLARRSKKLDQKYTNDFRKWQTESINKLLNNIDIKAENIRFIKINNK